ncbi:hypothetical protein HKX48_008086 [Thoreauomyces humboldtii]|nr:hypothetical protein HKX48_008086 [Thoreauomyces humboldtii]
MQAINLVLTPLDVALSLPFMRVGEFVLRRDPLPLSPAELIASIKEAGFWNAFGMLATGLGCAIVGWVFVMGPCGTALYFGLRPVLRKIMRKKHDAMMDDPLRGEEMEDPLLPRTRRRSTPDFPSTSS